VAQGKYSFLSLGEDQKKGRNQAQQQVFTNPVPINSANNLQTMPIGLVGGGVVQTYKPNPHPQRPQKVKATQRKPSMTNSKKQLDIQADINSELIQNPQQ